MRKMPGNQNNIDNTDQPTSQFVVLADAQVISPRKSSRFIAYML